MVTLRNLLGEQPGREVCAFGTTTGRTRSKKFDRRVFAICQHYNIPQAELLHRPLDHNRHGISP